MISGQQPRLDAVFGIQVIRAWRLDSEFFHFQTHLTGFALCGVPVAGGFAVGVSGRVVESDLTYATRLKSCSSVTCPWNDGIIGPKPVTIFACGLMIDSRIYPSSALAIPLLSTRLLPNTPSNVGPRPPSALAPWHDAQPIDS